MASATHSLVSTLLPHLMEGRCNEAVAGLQEAAAAQGATPEVLSLLRIAAQRTDQNTLYYLKLLNIWNSLGQPALKPNPVRRTVRLLTDYTSDNLAPLLKLFCGAMGVQLEVQVSAFDSVEQIALDPQAPLAVDDQHLIVVSLSEHWLARYLGKTPLVPKENISRAKQMIERILSGLLARRPGEVLCTNFPPRAYAQPGGTARVAGQRSWNQALAELNLWMIDEIDPRVRVVDLADALYAAGGRHVAGRVSYLRSKMIFEPNGTLAAARELATSIVQLLGKSHRALVTDWDNTLWGGEVAEAGSHGIVCGLDSPDALAYAKVQEYIKGLGSLGVLVAAVSRNDPQVAKILDENPAVVLKAKDFASLQVSFRPKSQSIAQVAQDLGFGSEFMVFVDDSLFELAEAIVAHPYLDIVRAGPDPELTLRALSESRHFNAVALSKEDLDRGQAALALKEQRDFQSNFTNIEDFLQEIQIRLEVAPLSEQNLGRVAQMFLKSNQFNLTTRRHGAGELQQLVADGGTIGVFSYEDTFGSQGIISVVNLVPAGEALQVESWVMSCRVLNRTVEQAVCHWIIEQAQGREVIGEFIPTEKNGLVRNLYSSLGFALTARDSASGREEWRFSDADSDRTPIKFFAQLRTAA